MSFLSREILKDMGFKKLGRNVLISDKASIYRPSVIEIGNNVRIDDFCILSPGDDGIKIGDCIHIGCQSTLIGRGRITLDDFANISSKVSIYSSNDDYSGSWMTSPMVPKEFTNVIDQPVTIGKHTIIGSSSVILPGIEIGKYCAIGSLSLVKKSIEEGWIVGGAPCRKISRRNLNLIDLESKYWESIKPEVSVIVPCYKFKKYIEKCILSIQEQITDFNFEVIVSDDYSCDGTIEILRDLAKKDRRIRVIEKSTNTGAFNNIRNLHLESKGKYIAYLDGDDFFTDPYKLQKQYDFLESNPEYSLHSTGYMYIDDENVPGEIYYIPLKETVTIYDILEVNFITFGKFYKNTPNLISDWMVDLEFLDWGMNLENLKHGKAKCENWIGGMYRVNARGMITSKTQEEIDILNEKTRNILYSEYLNYKSEIK